MVDQKNPEHPEHDPDLNADREGADTPPEEPSVNDSAFRASDPDLNAQTINDADTSPSDQTLSDDGGFSQSSATIGFNDPREDAAPRETRRRDLASFGQSEDDVDLNSRTLPEEQTPAPTVDNSNPMTSGVSGGFRASVHDEDAGASDPDGGPGMRASVHGEPDGEGEGMARSVGEPPVDLNAATLAGDDARLASASDISSGANGDSDLIDLNAATLAGDKGGETATLVESGKASEADAPLVDLTSRTISSDVQEQWAATITEDLTEGMTIKGDQQTIPGGDAEMKTITDDQGGHPTMMSAADANRQTHISVNPRAVLDSSARSRMRRVAESVSPQGRGITSHSTPGLTGGKVDFELIDVLGEGGMGIVYRARQSSIDRSIALKMIKKEGARDAGVRDKFLSEAAVTGDLDHPNIVPIYDLGDNGAGALFYAMKHVKGVPWCDVINDKKLGENLEILKDVNNAISFAHDHGVIHRDLKPENVMLGGYGEVLVMDWGLAAAVEKGAKAPMLTARTPVCGTPAYMSPEMAVGDGRKIGKQSDVYLLGAMLYEILAHQAPHTGKNVLNCLENAALNEIRSTDQDVSEELMAIAMRAMATDLDERYGSVKEFQAAIDEYESHYESIIISDQAAKDLAEAGNSREYDDFNKAIFGYQQALKMWDKNRTAQEGLSAARLQYAQTAFAKGDLDLAESQLAEETEPFRELRNKVGAEKAERERRARTLQVLRSAALVLIGIVIIGGTVLGLWINSEKNKADAAAEQAAIEAKRAAEQAEIAQKQSELADAEAKRANEQAEIAKKQSELAAAEAKRANEQAQIAEERKKEADLAAAAAKKAEAEAKENLATAEKAQIAQRLGEARENKLRDTSRWALTREKAKDLQTTEAAARELQPSLSIALPGDKINIDLNYIPAGRFTMGSPTGEKGRDPSEALHDVEITNPFYMGVLEVTREQWSAVTGKTAPTGQEDADLAPRHPVENVTFDQIQKEFIPRLTELTAGKIPEGFVWDLPTEAEWEYACRAGSPYAYWFGENAEFLRQYGWFKDNSGRQSHAAGKVALFEKEDEPGSHANAWGLYDMHGNVAEWCLDWYDEGFYLKGDDTALLKRVEMIYQAGRAPNEDDLDAIMQFVRDPYNKGADDATFRVIRGGGWFMLARHCRSAHRASGHPSSRAASFVGFRLILRAEEAR